MKLLSSDVMACELLERGALGARRIIILLDRSPDGVRSSFQFSVLFTWHMKAIRDAYVPKA